MWLCDAYSQYKDRGTFSSSKSQSKTIHNSETGSHDDGLRKWRKVASAAEFISVTDLRNH